MIKMSNTVFRKKLKADVAEGIRKVGEQVDCWKMRVGKNLVNVQKPMLWEEPLPGKLQATRAKCAEVK